MTYVLQPPNDSAMPDSNAPGLDTSLVQVARQVYANYCQAHIDPLQPAGVAVGRDSHRGQIIFNLRPVLLPDEDFVPFDQLEPSENEMAESIAVETK